MKHRLSNLKIAGLFLAVFLVCSCDARESDVLTLNFTSQGCSYTAPKVLPPVFTVNWVITGDDVQENVYIFLTLDEGKTKADLQAWLAKSTEHPSWGNILSYDISWEVDQTITKQHDLSSNGSYDGSPVYIICSVGDQLLVQGPVRIKE